jgi:hypothetical protein
LVGSDAVEPLQRLARLEPRYLKIGGHVVCRLADIETFEADDATPCAAATQPVPVMVAG